MKFFGKVRIAIARHTTATCDYNGCGKTFEVGIPYLQFYYQTGKKVKFWRNLHKWCFPFWIDDEVQRRTVLEAEKRHKVRESGEAQKVNQPRKPQEPMHHKWAMRRNYLRRRILEKSSVEVTLALLPEYDRLTNTLHIQEFKDNRSNLEDNERFISLVQEARKKLEYDKMLQLMKDMHIAPREAPDDAVEQALDRGHDEVWSAEAPIQ